MTVEGAAFRIASAARTPLAMAASTLPEFTRPSTQSPARYKFANVEQSDGRRRTIEPGTDKT